MHEGYTGKLMDQHDFLQFSCMKFALVQCRKTNINFLVHLSTRENQFDKT